MYIAVKSNLWFTIHRDAQIMADIGMISLHFKLAKSQTNSKQCVQFACYHKKDMGKRKKKWYDSPEEKKDKKETHQCKLNVIWVYYT